MQIIVPFHESISAYSHGPVVSISRSRRTATLPLRGLYMYLALPKMSRTPEAASDMLLKYLWTLVRVALLRFHASLIFAPEEIPSTPHQ
jgi:hypothetical protein